MNYLVYGTGVSGLSAGKLLESRGLNTFYYDDNKDNEHSIEELTAKGIDRIILSPGIAKKQVPSAFKGAQIIGDIELFFEAYDEARSVAITGTNGKSTVTSLLGAVFGSEGQVGGNIGKPICDLDGDGDECNIIEISSFQLDLLKEAEFTISVLLNITSDHLDRYGVFENYAKSKANIFNHSNVVLVNYDDPICKALGEKFQENTMFVSTKHHLEEGYYLIGENIYFGDEMVMALPSCPALLGEHNITNILFACAVAYEYCLDEGKTAKRIAEFSGLPHRMEKVSEKDNVKYINDSKATNTSATLQALKSLSNIRWLAGGVFKEDNLDSLEPALQNVKKAYLFGEAAEKFKNELEVELHGNVEVFSNMEDAIKKAQAEAEAGDEILLSPACASFDQFKNFEERGDKFKALVA